MIRVTIMLEPGGDKSQAQALAEITVVNISQGSGGGRKSSDYAWRIRSIDSTLGQILVYGCLVDNHNSNAVDIVFKVMSEWKSGRSAPINRHGKAAMPIKDHEAYWKIADPITTIRIS